MRSRLAASNYIITKKLGRAELEEIIVRLEMSDKAIGKIAFLSKLNVLTKDHISIIKIISELRNKLVHDIKKVSFCFDDYVNNLDKNQKKQFVRYAGHGIRNEVEHDGKLIPRDEYVLKDAKICVWLTVAEILAYIYLEENTIKLDKEKARLSAAKEYFYDK